MSLSKMRVIVIQPEGSKWMRIHFCKLLQRASKIESVNADGVVVGSDVADLWFPIPVGADLFESVKFILTSHDVADDLISLDKVVRVDESPQAYDDWDAVFSSK